MLKTMLRIERYYCNNIKVTFRDANYKKKDLANVCNALFALVPYH